MKKIYLSSLLMVLALALTAQENSSTATSKLTNKKGSVITPEQGDWCIGINASPFLNYIGNIININGSSFNTSPYFGFTAQHPSTIWGKYMITETKAYRVSATIGVTREVNNQPNATNNNNKDKYTMSGLSLGFTFGIENYRPVKNRLVGYYGYEAGIMFSPYQGPSRNGNYVIGSYTFEDGFNSSNGFTESGGNTLSLGAQGFLGAEYFFAPKMSLSGEFDLGLDFSKSTDRIYEPKAGTKEVLDAADNSIDLSPRASGNLALRLYF